MQNDFKVVRKRRNRNKAKTRNVNEDVFSSPESFVQTKVGKALAQFKESQYCFDFIRAIRNCCKLIGTNSVDEIICYGLGNFTDNKSGLHQLAALLAINEIYRPPIRIFDPVFKLFEINVLKILNFDVLTENEEGKRKLSADQVTLLFLPHCPKQITNNFLWTNWNPTLQNCILIGNSFSNIITNNTRSTIQKSAGYILDIFPKTVEIELIDNYCIDNIFNDFSIHYFTDLKENFFLNNIKPIYSSDIEFITSNTGGISLQDE